MPLQLIASDSKTLSMQDCPEWDSCSAPVCVLADWKAKHYEGEKICKYLREACKGEAGSPPDTGSVRGIYDKAKFVWANKDLLDRTLFKLLTRISVKPSRRSNPNLFKKAA